VKAIAEGAGTNMVPSVEGGLVLVKKERQPSPVRQTLVGQPLIAVGTSPAEAQDSALDQLMRSLHQLDVDPNARMS
jgi:hypothetical protein